MHTIAQRRVRSHVVQYVHLGTFVSMRARSGSGQIRSLGQDRFLVRISAGVDAATGKRRQPSRVVRGTHQDAERVRAELLLAETGTCASESTVLLRSLVLKHLAAPTKSGQQRAPYSKHREQRRFNCHVDPVLSGRIADAVHPHELTRLYDTLIAKGLKPSSVQRVHGLLSAAYSWGLKRGFVSSNPAKLAECPTARTEPPHAPSMETVQAHLEILQEDPETALAVRLAATIGLRRSEIAGLRWEHVDLDKGLVSITEGITVTPGQGASVTSTKTGLHGHGVLSIDKRLVAMLRDAFERLEKVAADVGADVSPDAYVFSSDPVHRKPINPDTLTKHLRRHMDRHPEIPSFTLKDLRAFTATMLEATGADITTAQAVLRHASGQTTMRHYRAARMDRVRGATVELGQLIGGV